MFNSDFIFRNFEWDKGSTNGIVYISEENIESRAKLSEIDKEIAQLNKQLEHGIKAISETEKHISDIKTNIARDIKNTIPYNEFTVNYTARNVAHHYSNMNFETFYISDEEILNNQKILQQSEPSPPLVFSFKLPNGIMNWLSVSQLLIQQSIPVTALAEFEAYPDALRWVEQGLKYHEEKNITDCLLCGNSLSGERRTSLRSLFSRSWDIALNKLNRAVEDGRRYRDKLNQFSLSIPNELQLNINGRKIFAHYIRSMNEMIEQLKLYTNIMIDTLENKIANPAHKFDDGGSNSIIDLISWEEQFKSLCGKLNYAITVHNRDSSEFKSLRMNAFAKIESHFLSVNQHMWLELHENLESYQNTKRELENSISLYEEKKTALKKEVEDHSKGADELNKLIHAYLGHLEISLKTEKNGAYKIIRNNRDTATELSEGERTAISFCYYLTQLKAENRKIEELVLIIDDPISSLDTSGQTHAYSLLKELTKNCAQVVILTHNLNFMSMIKREYKNLAKKRRDSNFSTYLSLNCLDSGAENTRSTSLEKMNPLLVKYDSEYHYLFSVVHKAARTKTSDQLFLLPNMIRKMLEIFLTFSSPGETNFLSAIIKHSNALDYETSVRALERLVQIESHGEMSGMECLPSLTIEEAIHAATASMDFIRSIANEHYTEMEKLCKD